MKKIRKYVFALACAVGLLSQVTAAEAQANYSYNQTYAFSNGCFIRGTQSNDNVPSASAIHAHLRNTYNTGLQCSLQMKVSYWDWQGTWHVTTIGWTNVAPDFSSYQAIWWVDYNASADGGAHAIGSRLYAPGCNINGC